MGLFHNGFVGIDLGTANTIVAVKGKGIIIREPSVVAVNMETKQIFAVGNEAKEMIGRTPANITAIRPLKDGVIADFKSTQSMLKYFIGKAMKITGVKKPWVLVGVPSDISQVEKKAVVQAAEMAGAGKVGIIEEALAAAIGADLPVDEPTGSMVIDIGGGTTDVAVISLGGLVISATRRLGGDDIDSSIMQYIRNNFNLAVGERTSENIKMNLACALEDYEYSEMTFKGRDLISGLPKQVTITTKDIYAAIEEPIFTLMDTVKNVLERTPPELSSDIMNRGIALTGGGALLRGLDKLIYQETGIECKIAEDPLDCVAHGTEKILDKGFNEIIFFNSKND